MIPFQMVIISGQVPLTIGDDAFQETDMIGVSSCRQTQFSGTSCQQIPEIVRKHFISQALVAQVLWGD